MMFFPTNNIASKNVHHFAIHDATIHIMTHDPTGA